VILAVGDTEGVEEVFSEQAASKRRDIIRGMRNTLLASIRPGMFAFLSLCP
jgi:Na+-translocating ferredoxin:NAD+ oxidoreductase RnfE subunit